MAWMNPTNREVGQRIKTARQAKGLSRRHVESVLGLRDRAIETYEQGARTIPEEQLVALANLLDVHPAVLRYGEESLRGPAEERRANLARDLIIQSAKLVQEMAGISSADVIDALSHLDDPLVDPADDDAPAPKKAARASRTRRR